MDKKRRMSINPTINNETEILSTIGKNLYLNAAKADVHFVFEYCDERVPAHKIILSGGSDVFETMFYGPLKEEGDIKIVDSTAEAFQEFLRFFYFNKLDVSMELVPDVMYLGRKYNVPDCLRLCASLLRANIGDETVINALDLAIIHEQQQLQRSCESFIITNLYVIFKSENFLVCDRRVLGHILKMKHLSCTEVAIFEACMSWVRAISHEDRLTRDIVQTHLGNLFYEIQFAAMTFAEFAELLPVYGELFTGIEYNEILQMISGHERKPKLFKASRRLLNYDSERLIVCDRLVVDGSVHYGSQSEDITKFSTNSWLMLRYFVIAPAVGAFNLVRIRNIENVNITITDDSTETVTQFTCTLILSIAYSGYRINLPTPISIRPEIIYEIRIKFATTEHRFSCLSFSPTANLEQDIVVNFQGDRNGVTVEAVRSLGFNLMYAD